LKLQFPNPWSKGFSAKCGFNIVPFVAVLHLLYRLQKRSNIDGLSGKEFCIFVPTLIDAERIDEQVDRILTFRKIGGKDKRREFILDFTKDFYGVNYVSECKVNNLFDYGDNAMRYFRLTKYFSVRMDPWGQHWRISLERGRMEEIKQMIEMFDGSALCFNSLDEYLEYMSDISKPRLPWERVDNLRRVAISLKNSIISFVAEHRVKLEEDCLSLINVEISTLDRKALQEHVLKLRTTARDLKLLVRKKDLLNNTRKIGELINVLEDPKRLRKMDPERFEKVLTDALRILNDELLIKPNYPMDDNGEPISYSPGNKPDIECYYEGFDAICEVTLNTRRTQWVQEGQPIMRHLRDFENKCRRSDVFCVFVSPRIHKDTYSQFWFSVRYEYDGNPQKIVPLTTSQFAVLLKKLLRYLEEGKKFTHRELYSLYKRIVEVTRGLKGFSEWEKEIDRIVKSWGA